MSRSIHSVATSHRKKKEKLMWQRIGEKNFLNVNKKVSTQGHKNKSKALEDMVFTPLYILASFLLD